MKGFSYPLYWKVRFWFFLEMLIPYLDDEFIIREFNTSPGFPDCFALRNGVEVGIEFEVNSSHFYEHKHHTDPNVSKCNLIVCWKNALGSHIRVLDKKGREHEIEILELKRNR